MADTLSRPSWPTTLQLWLHAAHRLASTTPRCKLRSGRSAPEQLRSAPPKQARLLKLPAFPITTIDSFPQTAGIRQARSEFKAGHLDFARYQGAMRAEIERCVQEQEALGLGMLVHGEAEYGARSASVFNCFYAHKNKKATRKGGLSC